MKVRSLPVSLLLLAGAAAPPAALALEGGPPPSPVRVEELRAERLREQRRIAGEVRAVRRSLVAAREGGVVLELAAREGSAVAAGDLLARLDAERLRLDVAVLDAQVAEAEAAVEEARSRVTQARRDAAALAALAERSAARPKESEDAETTVRIAEARVRSAEGGVTVLRARIALLQRRIEDTAVKAPFPGTVVALRTEVGAWVGEGDAVLELVSTGDLELRLDVPQRSLAPLSAHRTPLRVVVDATGAELDAAEWRIVAALDPASRTFPVLARLPAGAGLAPGMSLTVYVPTGEDADALTVSRAAILRGPTGPYVYVARTTAPGAPGTAAMVPVEVLFSLGDRAAVRGIDLAAGAAVVVEGNERLYPGAPVMPVGTVPAGTGGDRR